MTKRMSFGLVLALVTGIGGAQVLAQNAHIVGSPKVTVSGNTLVVSANVAGLGNVPAVDLTLEGTLDVFSQCYNKGGNRPQADNKRETVDVESTGTFPVRNGRTNATFTITPIGTLQCPGNQVAIVESASGTLSIVYEGKDLGTVNVDFVR